MDRKTYNKIYDIIKKENIILFKTYMDKLIELLLGLRKDVDALRDDVHMLAEKVDHLGTQNSNAPAAPAASQQHVASNGYNASYGRQLSASEKAYLDRLHGSHQEVKQEGVSQSHAAIPAGSAPQAPAPVYHRAPSGPTVIERFFTWLAKDWPMKIGGFFVIAAIGWFVTFASQQGWLSEAARVILGYVFAVSCIAFGALRAEVDRVQGNLFLIIGIASMMIATIAGISYEVIGITHITGLFIMLLSVGFVTLVSLRQKSFALTSSMIFFGALIPLFFFSAISVNTLFLYLFILSVGTLWVVSYTQWRSLTTMMLAIVGFYSIAYIVDASPREIESLVNIMISFIFIGVFYFANISAIIRSQKIYAYDMVTAIGIGMLLLIWITNFAPKEVEVFLLLIGALLFSCASFAIFRLSRHRTPTVLYAGVSAFLFVVATALQFDGVSLTVAYVVEAAVFNFLLMYFARMQVTQGMRVGMIAIYAVPLLMSLGSVFDAFDQIAYGDGHILDAMPHLFVTFMTCVTSFGLAIAAIRLLDGVEKENMTLFRIFAYVGGTYALILIWLVTHLFMDTYDVATFVSLVIYTLTGVMFYVMGVRDAYKPYMLVGGILFGIVVARVLLIEFWEMDVLMRIITSFVLGTLLISTAFIRSSRNT